MSFVFKDETIQRIQQKVQLHDFIKKELISDGVPCTISARNGRMLLEECPFCKAKKPAISMTKSEYMCFACGRGGNVFDFVMRYKNVSFVDAVEYVARKHNIATERAPFATKETTVKVDNLYRVTRETARYYFNQLRGKDGKEGKDYFAQREVSPQICSSFGLGYANAFGDNLYRYLLSKGFTEKEMLEAGVIVKSTKEGSPYTFYDRFYNRVMFPIINADNKVIGFGGRILGDGKPKYLNSSENQIFDKGKNLYGYNIAQKSALPYYIACEGYMDVMSLHQFGFDNAVASLGTALTRQQVQLLSTKKEVVLAYDSDEAGIKAAKRAISLCREVGISVRVVQFKGAKDPDEFLKKFGANALHELIREAESDKHFLIRHTRNADGKIDFDKAVEELP